MTVRYKPLPEPRSLEELRAIHRAVPADPTDTDDCCRAVATAASLHDRGTAREWLGFLEALELVDSNQDGYYRCDWPADGETLGDRFERRVLGARELLEVLDSETGATLDQLVPALTDSDGFELRSSDSAEDDIEGRVRRLLGWSLELGRVAKQDERYRRAADGERVE